MIDKLKSIAIRVLSSSLLIFLELIFLIIPQTIKTVAIVPLALVGMAMPSISLLPFLIIPGVWGMASLWSYFFSIIRNKSVPEWATMGLLAGVLAVFAGFIFSKPSIKLFFSVLPLPLVAFHWYYLKSREICVKEDV